MQILKHKILVPILGLLLCVAGTGLLPQSALAAEPAKCIISNSGSNLLDSSDDTYAIIDCLDSLAATLYSYQEGKYYQVNIASGATPQVVEITKDDYDNRADIIQNGTSTLHPIQVRDNGVSLGAVQGSYQCGGGDQAVDTKINFGCRGQGNPIIDILFAIIRFLSIGVGIVVVFSIILAGIQFTSSQGDPQTTAKAMERIRNTVIALILYIFLYAILNWLIPAGIFK